MFKQTACLCPMMICMWITYALGIDFSSLNFGHSFIAEILVCCLVFAGVVDVECPAEVSRLTNEWYSGSIGDLINFRNCTHFFFFPVIRFYEMRSLASCSTPNLEGQ